MKGLTTLLALPLLFACLTALGQETEPFRRKTLLRTARTYAKADNYAKVDETLAQAFDTYPEALADAELVHMEMEAQQQLFLAESKKLFLNSKPDTTTYFSRSAATTRYALRCDSLDQLPDKKGHVKPRYEKEIRERLRQHLPNLLSGGKYHYKRADYANAYSLFFLWLTVRENHLLASPALTADSIAVARLATLSAFSAGAYADALRYIHIAQQDTATRCQLMEVEARAHQRLNHPDEMLDVVSRGHHNYPSQDYFALALITHYDSLSLPSKALAVVERALNAGGNPKQYAYLSGQIYESMALLDTAALYYDRALAADSLDADVQSAAGMLALRRAATLRTDTPALLLQQAETKKQLNSFYTQAATHLESARALAPQQPELWKDGLREVYFRQGRGDDLRQIDTP